MGEIPSLLSLCIRAIARIAVGKDGFRVLPDICELPSDLFDCLVAQLPPLALQKLQEALCSEDESGATVKWIDDHRKRRRYGGFDGAWETLFALRWPVHGSLMFHDIRIRGQESIRDHDQVQNINWQQLYWETHLQNCLDEASEEALLPSFDGCIKEIRVSNTLRDFIGCSKDTCNTECHHVKLSYHCQEFGCYARCLRLQNILFVAGTCELLSACKLQDITIRNVICRTHADEVSNLLKQNKDTLSSLKFVHCWFTIDGFNKICNSLHCDGTGTHGIKSFSVISSKLSDYKHLPLPKGLLDFLSSGRSLCLVKFSDIGIGPLSARMIFSTLQQASSTLVNLELSDDNISSWLSKLNKDSTYASVSSSSPSSGLFKSLSILNLRGNNLGKDDADGLRYALLQMPALRRLDVSDNPLTDDGIRCLFPYFLEAFEKSNPLSHIKLESCSLSGKGVIQLLENIQNFGKLLHSLSLADNDLGSCIGQPLAKFLGVSHLKELNIEGVGLGPLGFQELESGILGKVDLTCINISSNRGGMKAADFVSKIILQAPELHVIDAGYNFIPSESVPVICDALKHSIGKLERLDLTGNDQLSMQGPASALAEFQFRGKGIVILSSMPSTAPYDDDP